MGAAQPGELFWQEPCLGLRAGPPPQPAFADAKAAFPNECKPLARRLLYKKGLLRRFASRRNRIQPTRSASLRIA